MRRFTRRPYYKGPDDPERKQVRGTLKLGETVVIETPGGADWEEALKIAWTEMVGLIAHRYDTTVEYANLIVGTIGDARPGYAAGTLNSRGFRRGEPYVTCQVGIMKDLRRTGEAFKEDAPQRAQRTRRKKRKGT